ncbi:glycosyltransferase family 9 protein [Acidisphaera sp. S103]|uniref:glycosyltransferase family 9 protein n=1 Tax=Acidisphaera sp. S103 TaxID=1747223 RepID=UPI00131B64E2|nr:glycosyltransferase family 9 protein [Acidisphaera sp. S103]
MLRDRFIKTYDTLGLRGSALGRLIFWLVRAFYRVAQRFRRAGRILLGDFPATRPESAFLETDRPDAAEGMIAFRVGGGIGDHLIAARHIRDLIAAAGEFRFDVYSSRPEVARWIFSTMAQFNRCYDDYFSWNDRQNYKYYGLAMTVTQFITIQYEYIKWGRINREWPKLVSICQNIDRFRHSRHLNEIISVHPYLDGSLGAKAMFTNLNRNNFVSAMSGIPYGGHRLEIAFDESLSQKLGLLQRPYLTIHNGFDAEFHSTADLVSRSTKAYPHFAELLKILRARRGDLFVVQLGSQTSQPIEGVDVQLIGETKLADVAAILSGSMLHIDSETGLVHLAACVGTVSCVMFGPTPAAYFGYDENINIAPRVCGGCWWTTKDWMINCPRGFKEPICLSETSPEAVADAILRHLDRREVDGGRLTDLPAMKQRSGLPAV